MCQCSWRFVVGIFVLLQLNIAPAAELAGVTITPHVQSREMRYRRSADFDLGARVELFLLNSTTSPWSIGPNTTVTFDGKSAVDLVSTGQWAWHDTPGARSNATLEVPSDALTVWAFNSRDHRWGIATGEQATVHQVAVGTDSKCEFSIEKPLVYLSAVTFLGSNERVAPNRLIVHVRNRSQDAIQLRACRLWLPKVGESYQVFYPHPWESDLTCFAGSRQIAAGDTGGFEWTCGELPLQYIVVEVQWESDQHQRQSLWAHLRVKREVFDISGGWVNSDRKGQPPTLHSEDFLKTLSRMHINASMHQAFPGYTDSPLYDKYPLKYMNRSEPLTEYDRDDVLPRIHAVEFLGEPQYGGGRPVPPQEVFRAFLPYAQSRLPTSVTHSEERIWRYYAGLSDYPHYDAYRVTAPSPDAWGQYDRWPGGQKIRWGAPLETIGEMTRSLRDLNRPRPIAYWSQGAHHGWGGVFGFAGRSRTSPTPDELRAQAWQGLGQRITSLYWFNLSVDSLVKFRDLIEPITRLNREIRLVDQFLLEGDAYEYRREISENQPKWDINSVMGPNGGILTVHDLDYVPDSEARVFRFTPRTGTFSFQLPGYLQTPAEVFRIDADGTHDVDFELRPGNVVVQDTISVVGVYVISPRAGQRQKMQQRHAELLTWEQSFGMNPAGDDGAFQKLKRLAE